MTSIDTVGDLVLRISRDLTGSQRQPMAMLVTSIDDLDETLSVDHDDHMTRNSYLGIGTEVMHVTSHIDGSNSPSVMRGAIGTEATSHAAGDTIYVDWRWFPAEILDAIVDEAMALPEEIFVPESILMSVGPTSRSTDAPVSADFMFILEEDMRRTGGTWTKVGYRGSRLMLGAGAGDPNFPSGNIYVMNHNLNGQVRLTYGRKPIPSSATIDLDTTFASLDIPDSQLDIFRFGAAARLLTPRENQRLQTEAQPDPRQAADVRTGVTMSAGEYWRQRAEGAINREVKRLRSLYPMRWK